MNPKCGKRVPTLYKNKGMWAWLCYDCSFKEDKQEIIIDKDEVKKALKDLESNENKEVKSEKVTGKKDMAGTKKNSKTKVSK